MAGGWQGKESQERHCSLSLSLLPAESLTGSSLWTLDITWPGDPALRRLLRVPSAHSIWWSIESRCPTAGRRTSHCKLPMPAEQNQANMEKPNRLHLLINDGLPIHKPAVLGRFKTKPCALAFYFSNNAFSCCVCFNCTS